MKVPVMTPQDDRIVAIMGPQIIPIDTMYDSNNVHMPGEDVYQGDISQYEGDAAMDDIPLLSPPAMDIPNAKDSSHQGESITFKTPKSKRKCIECEEMGDKKKEVLKRKLEILDIVRRKELVELEIRQVELAMKKAEAESKKIDIRQINK
ncbi:unnamed protein product [Diabrotica balteata]|uniref:Uncharacterized protein n=1 Tax=Diabrotica balteata TaxID=107213 RepID=A0A9N9XH68_DIABA|nr:unnamed protein product [Diabrotica balteata]